MSEALAGAVELLERSLGYTRVMLADVSPANLGAPTPCASWDLDRLLAHMDDALDAFLEAATGEVRTEEPARQPARQSTDTAERTHRVDSLRLKACALLGAWSGPALTASDGIDIGDRMIAGPVLVGAAALEIAVHGWDVGQATGRGEPIPEALATGLFPLARALVGIGDRGHRFGPPRTCSTTSSSSEALLVFLGRMTGPPGSNHAVPPSRGGIAS